MCMWCLRCKDINVSIRLLTTLSHWNRCVYVCACSHCSSFLTSYLFFSAALDLTTATWLTGSLSLTWTRGNAVNQNIQWDLKSCKSNFLDIFGMFDVSLGTSTPTSPYLASIPAKVGGSTCTLQATLLNSPFSQPAVVSFPGKQFPGIYSY